MLKAKKKEAAPSSKPTLGSVRNIKLTLEYDGTDFYGFQRQPHQPTVQQAIEEALHQLFQKKIKLASASSRTDAGVHAEGQVIHFKTTSPLPLFRIERGLNHFLPKTISVVKSEDVPDSFHARFQPSSKVYEYRVWNHSSHPVLWRNRVCHEPMKLNLLDMKRAARYFIGKHDFSAMTSIEQIFKSRAIAKQKISFTRTIKKLVIRKSEKMLIFTVEADGFLYHMVRNLVGTLVAVGKGKMKAEDIPKVLTSRNRKLAGPTLPASGLTLKRVNYPQ